MELEIERRDSVTIVTPNGAIDGTSAAELQQALLPLIDDGCKIVVDMSGVSYISSIGLRVLLLLYRETVERQGQIALAGLPEMIHDTMQITGFLDFFVAHDSVDAALSAVSRE